jgi:hypothetical protein
MYCLFSPELLGGEGIWHECYTQLKKMAAFGRLATVDMTAHPWLPSEEDKP